MKILMICLLFLFVFFVGLYATGCVDKFIKKYCSPYSKNCLELKEEEFSKEQKENGSL